MKTGHKDIRCPRPVVKELGTHSDYLAGSCAGGKPFIAFAGNFA
jgi:hypothetical protein